MKNKRALLTMGVAVLLGIGAVVLASLWLLGQPGNAASRIVVASGDISRGQRISPDMLRLVEWPAATVPKDAFTDVLKLGERVLKANVLKGEPLTEAKLAPAGTLGGLSALISEGKRAITVRVNDVIGVAGFALPGNYVDIIVHTERDPDERAKQGQGRNGLHISKIVLERILVLAVAQEVGRDETKPKVVNAVTLEVTPEQAEALDLARGVGSLSLALRNQVDPGSPQTAGATKASLLDELAAAAAAAVPPAPAKGTPAPPKAKAPARAAPRSAPVQVAHTRRDCVSVLNGVTTSQECF